MRPSSRPTAFLLHASLALALSLGLVGCKESQRAVHDRHRAQYTALRAEIVEYAKLEPTGTVKPPATLDPKPIFEDGSSDDPSNTVILMHENLVNPEMSYDDFGKAGKFRAGLDKGLPDAFISMAKTGPALDQKTFEGQEEWLTSKLGYRYVGVIKVATYRPPAVSSPTDFTPGMVAGRVWLIDRQTKQVVFADDFLAMNSPKIDFQYKESPGQTAPDSYKMSEAKKRADSDLWVNSRAAILAVYKVGTGGDFSSSFK